MCTLVFAWKVFPEAPVAVAANRDEQFDRPSHPPRVTGSETTVLAPGDERAGGTWIGVNEHRLFAGVTNRWVSEDLPSTRSRGLLVRDVLESASVADASERLHRALREEDYDGFNLLVADPEAAVLFEYDGTLDEQTLSPGVHVVINTGADGQYTMPDYRTDLAKNQGENADRVREILRPEPDEDAREWLDRAATILGNHEYGVCIHESGYGTVSTSLVALGADGDVTFRYADGPPCRTDAEPVDNHL